MPNELLNMSMIKIPVLNTVGKKVEDLSVSEKVFGLAWNEDLLHQAYTIIAGNLRLATAHTKNRAERAGSGKKPWKQKGTGRARVGSVRSPIWRKGGITFGPRNERNYVRSLNVKMRRKATAIALSGKVRENNCVVIEMPETVFEKTKDMAKAIDSMKLKGSVILGIGREEEKALRSLMNIEKVQGVFAEDLNVYTVLNTKNLILTKQAVQALEKRLQ